MCEPVTIGVLVASAAANAYAADQAAKGEAAADKANAQIERRAAADSEARGQQEAAGIREEGAQSVASQRAEVAQGAGVEGTGSVANIFASTAADAEYGAQVARANAAREAWGHRVNAANLEAKAAAAKKAGKLGILTSFLSGANSVAAYKAKVT